jgi:uncharacterized protein YbjQ (UPF0145 family)
VSEWAPLVQIGIPLTILLVGLFSGTIVERRHYRSIETRERAVRSLPVTNTKRLPDGLEVQRSWLVGGAVVISVDSFKALLASLQSFFGGRVSAYETLVDRARREAVLRLHEQAAGADLILNLRIETSSVGSGEPGESVSSVEAFAYATAVEVAK